MLYSDFHIHSHFSGDSDSPMESMIEKGISLGLKTMCFTEHFDADFPEKFGDFSLDTKSYLQEFHQLKSRYASQIELLFGVELGMQEHLGEYYKQYTDSYPFDFVIASQHLADGFDPYYPAYWQSRSASDGICRYFEETLANLKTMRSYDTLGHLDYIVRYSGNEKYHYSYQSYADYIDPILKHIIEEDKCLEVNTAGLKYGLGHPNPQEDVLKRYLELGGEKITIGSDGHKPEHLAYDFSLIPELLKSLGFRYYFIFRKRTPEAVSLF